MSSKWNKNIFKFYRTMFLAIFITIITSKYGFNYVIQLCSHCTVHIISHFLELYGNSWFLFFKIGHET